MQAPICAMANLVERETNSAAPTSMRSPASALALCLLATLGRNAANLATAAAAPALCLHAALVHSAATTAAAPFHPCPSSV